MSQVNPGEMCNFADFTKHVAKNTTYVWQKRAPHPTPPHTSAHTSFRVSGSRCNFADFARHVAKNSHKRGVEAHGRVYCRVEGLGYYS